MRASPAAPPLASASDRSFHRPGGWLCVAANHSRGWGWVGQVERLLAALAVVGCAGAPLWLVWLGLAC